MANIDTTKLAAVLAQLVGGGTENEDTTVQFRGSQIILPAEPEKMDEDTAIDILERRRDENNRPVNVRENIPGYPLDAILAVGRVLKRLYGWTDLRGPQGFFGESPPTIISVPVDAKGTTAEVPWGRMQIPGIKGWLEPEVSVLSNGQPALTLVGKVQKRSLDIVKKVAALAREELRQNSIYQGKAINLDFAKDFKEDGFDPETDSPKFMVLNGITREKVIYNRDIEWAIQTSVYNPIDFYKSQKAKGRSFRRTVVLAGKYGMGKSILGAAVARACEDQGITFIHLDRTSDIAKAREFARQYQPAVIYAEDIDAVMSGDSRDEDINDILNTLDGVEGKSDDVMVITSTNHPERINRALLRPGRVDVVQFITAPNAETVERLLRLFGGNLIPANLDLSKPAAILAGHSPAAVAEVVKRAELAILPKGDDAQLTGDDLLFAAESMKPHLALLEQEVAMEPTDIEKLGAIVGHYIQKGVAEAGESGGVLHDTYLAVKALEAQVAKA